MQKSKPAATDNELLQAHRKELEGFAEKVLRPYINRVCAGDVARGSKEFNDPIWGTIRLEPLEVTILDSPLLQRLRRIRQLGVVHLVYMGATHSRLEHSLGVVHQVQRLVDSLNARGIVGQTDHIDVVSDDLRETLRLAGLCHDIGHGAMSHVSEYGLDGNRECRSIRGAFDDFVDSSHESQLSEMAAYFLLGSPAFRELLTEARRALKMPPRDDQPDQLQKLVVGARVDNEVVLAQEMISGPFDADKLDYLARDATMCGVPIVTDVTRLIQKVRASRAQAQDLPNPLQTRLQENANGYVVTGLARSGGSTLMELALARVLMFDKVYRHHAVRAAESMVFEIVSRLARLAPYRPGLIPLLLGDEELMDLTPESIARFIDQPLDQLNEAELSEVHTIADIAARIRNRRLFVRGFAIAGTMTNDQFKHDEEHANGLKLFLQDLGNSGKRAKIENNIVSRLRRIVSLLDNPQMLEGFEPNLDAYVHVSPPKSAPKTMGTDTDHAFLVDEDGRLTSFHDDAPETTGWSDAYIATHDLGHVFCPSELAPYVFLAAEAEVRAQHGIRVPASMLPYAKQSRSRLDEIRRNLLNAGFYEDLPTDLRPSPKAFDHAGFGRRVELVANKLEAYLGPTVGKKPEIGRQSAAVVRDFLKQFDDENEQFVELALEMLGATRQLKRQDVSDALRAFVEQSPEFEGANICTLGSMKDSSAIFANLALDFGQQLGMATRDLREALSDDRPIVFVDDFVGRGSQTVDILQAWLGLDRSEDLDEARDELTGPQQALLRERRFGLVYLAGLDEGRSKVEKFLREESLDGRVFVHIRESDLPTLDQALSGKPGLAKFKEFLRVAGRRALANHNGKPRDEAFLANKAMGFGDRELLFTSIFNTPTAALTALWAGNDPNVWQPIFPRRTKK